MGAIMIQGTSSDAGKSLVAAGLCRAFMRRGLNVRPFKPQNMSNNAAVTSCGREIGRAQALQARACGIPATVHMNPILLKPQTDVGSQLIVHGKILRNTTAREYYTLKDELLPAALDSFALLKSEGDLVVAEGAGSPAEVNLRHADIANMGFALPSQTPVILVGDIERGGVIASLLGTWQLLAEDERSLVAGYIVNKFRGDPSLFDDGVDRITHDTNLPCFGVLPWFEGARKLPAEDALALSRYDASDTGAIRIAVPVFSRVANFDDLDPLAAEPDVELVMVRPGETIPGDTDLILLTGSKSTRADLDFLHRNGWDIDIQAHVRRGGLVLGLCAGYQMLGRDVADPDGIESAPGTTAGLGLLDVTSSLTPKKTLKSVTGIDIRTGLSVSGYEMHVGTTTGPGTLYPMLQIDGRNEGAVSSDGLVSGCYLHGLFADDEFRHQFLAQLRPRPESGLRYEHEVETTLDDLAAHCEAHLDLDAIAVAAGVA